mgnify:CR=1 FL=1
MLLICIFCTILNNLSRFVSSHADVQIAAAHLMASSFSLYKNRGIFKLIIKNHENSSANSRKKVSLPQLRV